MSILEILEAHRTLHVAHLAHTVAMCNCGTLFENRPAHRAHVAQVLEQHEREAKAEAVRESARYIERLMPPGLVHREAVLADLTVAELRIGRGLHANGRDRNPS